MKYFGNTATKAARVGCSAVSVIRGILIVNDINEYLKTYQNPIYWPFMAVDLTITADLILTAYTGKILPITTILIGKIPYGKRLLGKIENLYDFLLGINEVDSHKV